jgi:hypothetical protein
MAVAVLGALGVVAFGAMVWRSTSIESAEAADAERQFAEARASLPPAAPLVTRDGEGRLVRRATTETAPDRATILHVLAYHARQQRLLRADVPLWFAKVKGPAVQYALRDTRFDLETLHLTARDLENFGAGIVFDDADASGDRLLAWTE